MELSESVSERIDFYASEGNDFYDDDRNLEAIESWMKGVDLLPEPNNQWDAYGWFMASIGDAYYFEEDYDRSKQALMNALNSEEGRENPLVHYRLGQCEIELGNEDKGIESLLKAYMLDGESIFELDGEDGAFYLNLIKKNVRL